MRKLIFVLFFIEISFSYAHDFRGYWSLNSFENRNIYKTEQFSWGDCEILDNDSDFLIDKQSNEEIYLYFRRWGKIKVDSVFESDGCDIFSFKWNNYRSSIWIKLINSNEAVIVKADTEFNMSTGPKNRFFRISGPKETKTIKLPLKAITLSNLDLIWCNEYLGEIPANTSICLVFLENNTNYYDDIKNKKVLIKINEDELLNFNKEYYQKYNLERKNEEVYGELYLKDLEIEEKIQIE